jgi:hypothetical protein
LITDGEDAFEIRPPINMSFDCRKSIEGEPNGCKITLYNLGESKRVTLTKDDEDTKYIGVELLIGYEGQLIRLFKGNLQWGSYMKEGADYKSEMECVDGGIDYQFAFTSRTVKDKDVAIDEILRDMPHTSKGKVTKQNRLLRPKVLVGNSHKLLQQQLNVGETYFVDDEALHVIKDDEVLDDLVPVVSPATGLISTPQMKQKELTFDTMLNPTIRIGALVDIQSATAKHLNGQYKVKTITYGGEYEGANWNQQVTCVQAEGLKAI